MPLYPPGASFSGLQRSVQLHARLLDKHPSGKATRHRRSDFPLNEAPEVCLDFL